MNSGKRKRLPLTQRQPGIAVEDLHPKPARRHGLPVPDVSSWYAPRGGTSLTFPQDVRWYFPGLELAESEAPRAFFHEPTFELLCQFLHTSS